MMKRLLLVLMVLTLLPIGVTAGEKSPWEVKLPFKSATIHYTISGMENGSEITYIRDYGDEVATYHTTKMNMMGMIRTNETVEIVTPDWVYDFDLTEQTGVKRVNPKKYMIEEYNKLSKAEQKEVLKNAKSAGTSVTKGLGGNVQQNAEKFLGYSCDRAEMMGTVVLSIHGSGIPLRVESNMMGMSMKIEATSVTEGKVDSKFFRHPEGIKPVLNPQADSMAREMARQTIALLKDPESAKKSGENMENMMIPTDAGMSPEEQEQMQQAMEMLKGMFGGQKQQ